MEAATIFERDIISPSTSQLAAANNKRLFAFASSKKKETGKN
jgi:hypothetical protein